MPNFSARISQLLTRWVGAPAVHRRHATRSIIVPAAVFALLAGALIGVPSAPAAAAVTDPCGTGSNTIACENSKPGTDPSVWDISGAGDTTIQGFGTDISVNVGGTIGFKVKTPASTYTIAIYRTGYYQGLGARFIANVSPSASLPQSQPPCAYDTTTELTDCGNWGLSASWAVPSTAVSGVYVALLHRNDTGGESHIIFVVRDDSSHSDVLFQTSDPTWQAYNSYGGANFYQGGAAGRAYKLSYNRPFVTRSGVTARDFYFSSEFAQVQFLERNGYNMTYAAGVDTDRYGSLLLNHKVFLSVGHDEYWSTGQRANVEVARNAGVNLQFLSGNEVYWHTRYEASTVDPSSNGYRTLVSYKETWGNAKIDPSTTWTGTWRDPRFAPPSAGAGNPENALTGTMYMANDDDLPITVTANQGKTRLWRGTPLTSLAAGTSQALAAHTLGYESDEVVDNGFSPAGLINLSTTVGASPQMLQDFGSVVAPGTTTHHLTLYRTPSGALVFGAGTIQWAWGLTQNHDGAGAAADPRMQQAQINILADMGAQPLSLMSGLVAASMSTDTTAPTVTVATPNVNATLANGTIVTVTGTASDVGGVVAGVEVSTDGGTTWHPATGTTSWTYTYSQSGNGAQSIRVRATDDSGNFPATPTIVPLTATGPYTVYGAQTPKTADSGDASAVELGQRFAPSASGLVTGVRFYKSTANTGVHTGSLWDSTGALLAQVTFSNETASGWQTASFSTPVSVTSGHGYVISYTAPKGHYSGDSWYWAYSSRLSPPLIIAHAYGDPAAGVYANPGTFPTSSYQNTNYWVDVVFDTQDTTPPVVTARYPLPNSTCAATSTAVTVSLSGGITASSVAITLKSVAGTTVVGSTVYDSTAKMATFTPAAALTANTSYAATIAATGATGTALASNLTWTFTTASGSSSTCPVSIFADTTVPQVAQVVDSAVTLGVTFSATSTGSIAGIRFYKGPGNTGTHTGTLWSSTGTQLAAADFTSETASGWQSVYFSQPVAVTAGTQYVASYRTTTGSYSTTAGAFTSALTSGFLAVPASGARYSYAAGFPSSTSTTNYFVDVLYTPGAVPTGPPTVVSQVPAMSATAVATTSPVSAVLSADPGTTIPTISVTTGTTAVAGTTSYNSTSKTLTFTPTAAFAASTSYSVVVASGATALSGGTWSFTTAVAAVSGATYNLIQDSPVVISENDSSSVELGMAFTSSQAGLVTAIRFYKGSGNTGTHTGSIWSSTGTRLATVTFTGETATGWQTAALATPLALTAGKKYIVSYLAPFGRYSDTTNYFSTARSSGPLTADTTSNGQYLYASAGGFPTSSYNATNYFVDVTFSAVSVVSTTPTSGATEIAASTTVSAVMSAEGSGGTPTITLTGSGGTVAGTSAYSTSTHTATFTLSAALATSTVYSATVSVGGTALPGGSWSFTTAVGSSGTSYSLISATPTTAAENDSGAVEVGMAFSSSLAGTVSAIRFYKGTGNTGTHTGSLWSSTGTRLATVTFTGETATGWQTATLATPYSLTAETTYVVSYFAPSGHYADTGAYFATARTSGPLTASTSNGRYLYASTGGFPTSTYNSTNYFVDVVFTPTSTAAPAPSPTPTPAPTPTGPAVTLGTVAPAAGEINVAPTVSATAAVTGADAATVTLQLAGPSGAIAGTSTYAASSGIVSFSPTSALAWSTAYTVSAMSGTTQIGSSWSFTTAATPTGTQSIFAPSAVPVNVSFNDPSAVQVGTRFTSSVAGTVTAIRFYKGSANTGAHTGYLWSSNGTELATVTFTAETASGWQQMTLTTPVSLVVGAEYRVGLYSATGMYAADANGLASPMTSGSLSTPASGGAYVYGTSTSFLGNTSPQNFWVDVVFVPTV